MSGRVLMTMLAAVMLVAAEPAPPPEQPLSSPAQEARAQALFDDIRCVVCQHEAIADSPAGIAADMRRLVRDEIAAGRTDAQIRADLIARYGDYVLFRPPFRPGTLLLWLGPLALLLAVGAGLFAAARRRPPEPTPLSPDEEARLADVLRSDRFRPDPDASTPHDGR